LAEARIHHRRCPQGITTEELASLRARDPRKAQWGMSVKGRVLGESVEKGEGTGGEEARGIIYIVM
jgi:hypothetical protein